MGSGGFHPSGGLEIRTVDGGLIQQVFDSTARQVFERINTASGMGDGHLALRAVERIRELRGCDDDLRHLPVPAGTDEIPPGIRLKNHMQHHIIKCRICGVAVRIPCRRNRVQFQRPGTECASDLHRSLDEVRTSSAVPLAKLRDSNWITGRRAEVPAEGAGKPQRLELQFRWQGGRRGFRKGERRVPY